MCTNKQARLILIIVMGILFMLSQAGCSGLNLSGLQPPSKPTSTELVPGNDGVVPAPVGSPGPFLQPSPEMGESDHPLIEPGEGLEPQASLEEAKVDNIEIMVSGSIPVELQVAARGTLTDECVSLGEAQTRREGNTFIVTLVTQRQEGEKCEPSPVTFEKKIPLDVRGLAAGLYTVDVNGVIGTFEFAMDNIAPQDYANQPPTGGFAEKNTISGLVWHDLCALTPANQGGSGCVRKSDGKETANGILETGEPGLDGVRVFLKQGDCMNNANILQSVATDSYGKYIFRNVPAGDYCVQVDASDTTNRVKLLSGLWTYPTAEGSIRVALREGEGKSNINFGWDFQSDVAMPAPQDQFNFVPAVTPLATPMVMVNTPLPQPMFGTPQAYYPPSIPVPFPQATLSVGMPLPQAGVSMPVSAFCLNRSALVSESIAPNGPNYQPGMNIVKTWRVQNIGTCVWQTGYTLVFVGGDQMNAVNPTVLTGEVLPNNTVDISVQVTAPNQMGVYTGNWMLRSLNGEVFGFSDFANQPLMIQISVSGTPAYPTTEYKFGQADELKNLGAPTWYDSFWNDSNWYMLNDENTVWQVKNGALYMMARKKIDIDRWGLSKMPSLTDFYYEIEARSGPQCGGFDSYGVTIRAQDFDSGYVFGITCNGTFRLYQWDHGFFKNIQPYKASDYLRMGAYKTNRLGVMAVGNKLRLYANGYFLGEYTTDWYKWGQFGLMLGPNQTENLTILVTEAAYWQFR